MKILLSIIGIFFSVSLSQAVAATDISLTVFPETPAPFSDVRITLQSYMVDINTASITWYVRGAEFKSGFGEKSITVAAGGIGSTLPVRARITLNTGDVYETTVTISPQSVDMIWESVESYIPPFYEGKALPGEGSVVKVTALPTIYNGTSIVSPAAASYAWYLNGQFMESVSGAKKQSALIPLSVLEEKATVRVRVTVQGGPVVEKSLNIYPHTIMPLLYPYDATLGANLARSFSQRIEIVRDTIFSLQPYYLSTRNGLDQSSSYTWFLDGLPVTPEEKTLLAVRPKENSQGARVLVITIENLKRKLQKAELSSEVIFDTR